MVQLGPLLQGFSQATIEVSASIGGHIGGWTGEGSASELPWLMAEFSSPQAVGLRASAIAGCWLEDVLMDLSSGVSGFIRVYKLRSNRESLEQDRNLNLV